MGPIHFFQEDIDYSVKDEKTITDWIEKVIQSENQLLESLNYIFCSDNYLHKINLEYLDHDDLTDIITFNNAEAQGIIEGDIFISIERIRENSTSFNKTFENELYRVIIHGVLHLLGYSDKSRDEKLEMRSLEDKYLEWLSIS